MGVNAEYHARKERGLCTKCGEKERCKTSLECERCRDERRNRHKGSHDKTVIDKICSTCNKRDVPNDKKTCCYCLNEHKKRRDKLKDIVYEAYGGYICNCCGETTKDFLTLDHINNDGADHKRMISGRSRCTKALYHWLIKNNFPPIIQVLCWNCNCGKARNGGVCPHKK